MWIKDYNSDWHNDRFIRILFVNCRPIYKGKKFLKEVYFVSAISEDSEEFRISDEYDEEELARKILFGLMN